MIIMSIELCFLIVELKPPIFKPVLLSSKDLFDKCARDEKSKETDSSKMVMMFSPLTSPANKKLKSNLATAVSKSDTSMPLVGHGYTIDSEIKSFTHFLDDPLLPQSVEGHSSKSINQILDHSAGHTVHVSIC